MLNQYVVKILDRTTDSQYNRRKYHVPVSDPNSVTGKGDAQ